jgi:hypothetical protein
MYGLIKGVPGPQNVYIDDIGLVTYDGNTAPAYVNDSEEQPGGGLDDGEDDQYTDIEKTFDLSGAVKDNVGNPVEPNDSLTFTLYGLTGFQVQAWNGTSWVTLGGTTGNRYVKRTVSFSPYTTSRIRILGTGAADGAWCRITEIEAGGI